MIEELSIFREEKIVENTDLERGVRYFCTIVWTVSMVQLATRINEITKNPAGIVFRPLPKDDPTRRKPNITRANQELGWTPEVSFIDGVRQTISYFRERM